MTTVNIPESLIAARRKGPTVLRTADLVSAMSRLREHGAEQIICLQILDPAADLRPLIDAEKAGPVEVVVQDPGTAIPLLYRLSDLVRVCPVRVSIKVCPGFLKAVRVAASLHCAVKLEVGQPGPGAVAELLDALAFYLHGEGVTEPIEFFHTLLTAVFHDVPITLWDIQEEDPATFRYLTDDGRETPPGRLAQCSLDELLTADGACNGERLSAHAECGSCPFRAHCGGYFKWPNPAYRCDGVRELLGRVLGAVHDLKGDIAEHTKAMGAESGE